MDSPFDIRLALSTPADPPPLAEDDFLAGPFPLGDRSRSASTFGSTESDLLTAAAAAGGGGGAGYGAAAAADLADGMAALYVQAPEIEDGPWTPSHPAAVGDGGQVLPPIDALPPPPPQPLAPLPPPPRQPLGAAAPPLKPLGVAAAPPSPPAYCVPPVVVPPPSHSAVPNPHADPDHQLLLDAERIARKRRELEAQEHAIRVQLLQRQQQQQQQLSQPPPPQAQAQFQQQAQAQFQQQAQVQFQQQAQAQFQQQSQHLHQQQPPPPPQQQQHVHHQLLKPVMATSALMARRKPRGGVPALVVSPGGTRRGNLLSVASAHAHTPGYEGTTPGSAQSAYYSGGCYSAGALSDVPSPGTAPLRSGRAGSSHGSSPRSAHMSRRAAAYGVAIDAAPRPLSALPRCPQTPASARRARPASPMSARPVPALRRMTSRTDLGTPGARARQSGPRKGSGVHECIAPGCSARFTTPYSKMRHFNAAHAGVRSFHCVAPQCYKIFATRDSLKRHSKMHVCQHPLGRRTGGRRFEIIEANAAVEQASKADVLELVRLGSPDSAGPGLGRLDGRTATELAAAVLMRAHLRNMQIRHGVEQRHAALRAAGAVAAPQL